jgi:periplasmic protein TonB
MSEVVLDRGSIGAAPSEPLRSDRLEPAALQPSLPDAQPSDGQDERAGDCASQPDRPDRDPFERVLGLGRRAMKVGLAVGFALATSSHGALGARALASPSDMRHWVEQAQLQVHAYLWAAYDVDMVKPEAAKPLPKPEPEKEQEDHSQPAPKAAPAAPADHSPPPPPAQAGKVLTAQTDPNEPVDLTDPGFVQGEGSSYVGGSTAAAGTGTAAVYNPGAKVGGTPGGTGSGPVASAAPKLQGPDLSKPPGVASGASWSSCDFPQEADVDQIDYAVVTIVVTVRVDGSPQTVRVLEDPGHGFGRAARLCALTKRFTPGTDHDGNPMVGTTPPIRVTFTR